MINLGSSFKNSSFNTNNDNNVSTGLEKGVTVIEALELEPWVASLVEH